MAETLGTRAGSHCVGRGDWDLVFRYVVGGEMTSKQWRVVQLAISGVLIGLATIHGIKQMKRDWATPTPVRLRIRSDVSDLPSGGSADAAESQPITTIQGIDTMRHIPTSPRVVTNASSQLGANNLNLIPNLNDTPSGALLAAYIGKDGDVHPLTEDVLDRSSCQSFQTEDPDILLALVRRTCPRCQVTIRVDNKVASSPAEQQR